MAPWTFRELRTIRVLNVLGVALGLTALVLRVVDYQGNWVVESYAPTPLGLVAVVAVSLVASVSLRGRSRVANSTLRWGWLGFTAIFMAASVGLSVASDVARFNVTPPVGMLVVSGLGAALLGGIASLFPLALLGLPVAHAQSLARKGLAGEERGERIVGIGAALAAALVAVQLMVSRSYYPSLSELLPVVPAALSILLGLVAAFLANGRERSRTTFVKEVEAGRVAGYRIDPTEKGKVLVRVTAPPQDSYREAERHEALVELDEEGAALRQTGR